MFAGVSSAECRYNMMYAVYRMENVDIFQVKSFLLRLWGKSVYRPTAGVRCMHGEKCRSNYNELSNITITTVYRYCLSLLFI